MRIIPGKTKVGIELFRGITIADMIIGAVGFGLGVLIVVSNLPAKIVFLALLFVLVALLLVRIDDEPLYHMALHILLHYLAYHHRFERVMDDKTLLEMNENGHEKVAFEKIFQEGEEASKNNEKVKKRAQKDRKKALKAERKADDKLLRSHKLTKEEEDAIWLKRANQSAASKAEKKANREEAASTSDMSEIVGFTEIKDGVITYSNGYYGAAVEIPPVAFRFFSKTRRNNAIESGLGAVLRSIHPDYAVNIVKIDQPEYFDSYIKQEHQKVDAMRRSFENGVLKEDEFRSRTEVVFDRVNDLERMNDRNRVVVAHYYLVLYDRDPVVLRNHVSDMIRDLQTGGMSPHRLTDKELAVFLKYSNTMDFDARDIEKIAPQDYATWAQPRKIEIRNHSVVVDNIITHNMHLTTYPLVVGNAWLAGVMSIPSTKVVIKCQPMDRSRSIRAIDHSLQELRGQYMKTGVDSKRIELQNHIHSLEKILGTLQNENETLLCTNVYVTAYDKMASKADPTLQVPNVPLREVNGFKKMVRRSYRESGFRLNTMQFCQTEAFIGGQINGYDPLSKTGRGIPSNTVAATFPWIYAYIKDSEGIKYGRSQGAPVFIDFFKRDSERVNSNMVIVGKSGSGKSYATKSILTNLAAEDSKIFVLDPENEYTELARNLHGKFINVGNAQFGRLNPFQIITGLDDDENGGATVSGSYATHLQFLEEFFKQILPDCEKDALEYLNSMIDRLYTNMGITSETDLRTLQPEDYPIFDDLYDLVLEEFQISNNDYIRSMLRTLMNYISKFSTGGRNANIWNGPSTVATEENFTVFNFQSLLANRNGTVANAQMLLVLKYIDNEIIKNREYNMKYNANRKIVVVIDEAHVFIDTKYPVALDFMFQLAKRIRKYNGMQIVITQNIKDFVGSEEIARKSTAIINACQYSLIFSLAPNDMEDLCKLYEKAGGINETEQEEIITAPRGQAFTIMSAQSRSTVRIQVPDDTVKMFQDPEYETHYFGDENGRAYWEKFVGDSRSRFETAYAERHPVWEKDDDQNRTAKHIVFDEISAEELNAAEAARQAEEEDARRAIEEETRRTMEEDFARREAELVRREEESRQRNEAAVSVPASVPVSPMPAGAGNDFATLMSRMNDAVTSMKELSYEAIMGRVEDMLKQNPAAPVFGAFPEATPRASFAPAVGTSAAQESQLEHSSIFGEESDELEEADSSEAVAAAEVPEPGSVSLGSIFDILREDETEEETETEESDGPLSLGSIFDIIRSSDSDESEESGEGETSDDETGDARGDSSAEPEVHFDFMSQLVSSLESYSAQRKTCLAEMELNNESKRAITLADLKQYIQETKKGNQNIA